MKRTIILTIFIFLIFSVTLYSQEATEKNYTTFSAFLTEQNAKIAAIENGISLVKVKEIMGSAMIVNVPKIGKMKALNQLFKQPEFTKETTDRAKNEINILWYFSTPKNQDGIVSRSECTPVIIKNDSVVGKGTKFYLNFMRTEQIRF
ncbi:MAG: hypothetical protein CVU08_10065 [Bacteroidetes bacterium HGW-Bacteroidetes-3]|jgi:hypothetical protein|nr:MAG: hypothetical protein CVU08_10065 [Bacteroidetes bacterium HGW-Bacteroidetes-3]